jgi:hypothetical protein
MSDGTTSAFYSSDTTIIATNNKDEFVISTIIGDVTKPPPQCKDMAIAVTGNNGATFSGWKVISTENEGFCNVDQPTIAFSKTSNKLWAWWRDSSSPYPPGCDDNSNCHFKQYMREFHITSGAFVMDTNPIRVDQTPTGGFKGPNGLKARLALGKFQGVETIFATWSDTNDTGVVCHGGSDDSGDKSSFPQAGVHWLVASSTNAQTWTPIQQLPGGDDAWPRCVGPGRSGPANSAEASFGVNRNLPVPVLDTAADEIFVVVNESDNKVLPATKGTRLHLFGTTQANLSTWHEIPLPTVKTNTLQDHWGQWLSYVQKSGESTGRLGLTWLSTGDDPNGANRQITVRGTFSTNDGATFEPSIGVATGTGVPWFLSDKWGDYNGGAGSPIDGSFLPAWTDNRTAGQAEVWGRQVIP